MSDLGVVAIGRNEGERLRRCLNSVVGHGLPVVYVDSSSTDSSVELARSMGAEVVELDLRCHSQRPGRGMPVSSACCSLTERSNSSSLSTATVRLCQAGWIMHERYSRRGPTSP